MALRSKFYTQYQNVMISGVLIVLSVVGILGGVLPSIGKIQSMFDTIGSLRDETAALSKKLSLLNSLDEGQLRDQLSSLLAAVPSDRSFPTLFETVEGVAGQTGVSMKSMEITGGASLATPSAAKASTTEKKLGARTVPFSVTIEGSMDAVEQFIAMSPQVRRLLRIKLFSITFPRDQNTITTSVTMDTFYAPLPTSLGSTGAKLSAVTPQEEDLIGKISEFPLVTNATGELPPPQIGQVKTDPFSP